MVSQLDPGQIIKHAYDDATQAFKVDGITGVFITSPFDEIDLTYVAAGNGVGEIQTAVYKNSGITVNTLTMTYDASNRLSTVVKT